MDSPTEQMFKNFDVELRKRLQELNIEYVEWGNDNIKFVHAGYSWELKLKQIKSLMT